MANASMPLTRVVPPGRYRCSPAQCHVVDLDLMIVTQPVTSPLPTFDIVVVLG